MYDNAQEEFISFGKAMDLLKEGNRVFRDGWVGKYLIRSKKHFISDFMLMDSFVAIVKTSEYLNKEYNSNKYIDSEVSPYFPNVGDLFARWYIYKE